jgi:hypothetical protein
VSAPKPEQALPAAKWLPIIDAAGITPPGLADAKTQRARAIKVGQWLSAKVGREMPVSISGRDGKAVLRVFGARANEKRYYIEVTWNQAQASDLPTESKRRSESPKIKAKAKVKTKTKPTTEMKGRTKPTTEGNDENW